MQALQALRDSLRAPVPVYQFVGSDPWLARAALEQLRAAVLAAATRAFNDATFSAGEDRINGVIEIAHTVPMMAARRLVVVKQLEDAPAAFLEGLLTYVQAPVPSTTLVLMGERFPGAVGGVDRGLRITNAVKKTGFQVKYEASAVDPVDFARMICEGRTVTVEPAAVRRMVEYNGGELSLLASGLERCADFVGAGGTVTAAVVDDLCVSTVEAEVWGLTDAIVTRDKDRALATLHRLLEDGEAVHKLLASVAWQLRQVLALQDVIRRGLPERDANLRMPPQKARAIKESLARRPLSPSGVLEELAGVNRLINSSRAGDRRVFEAWITRLVAA